MPLISHVDYVSKRIFLSSDTVDSSLDTLSLYKEMRSLRRNTEGHRKFKPMIIAGGNLEKIPGITFTPSYVQLLYGCRIVPYNVSHKLKLVRDTFTDDGYSGRDCFDRGPLSETTQVDVDVDFPEIEIRQIAVSGNQYSLNEIASAVKTEMRTEYQAISQVYGNSIVEELYTRDDILRLLSSVVLGNATGLENGSPDFKSLSGAKSRIKATYNSGSRTITYVDKE